MKRVPAVTVPNIIIDFDSTFTTLETLDELAAIALKDSPDREKIVAAIKQITSEGMEGKITIAESLRRRVGLLHADRKHVDALIKLLRKNVTPSFSRNKTFFKRNKGNIYILSSGFKEIIVPVVAPFGISESHVLANTFTFDKGGAITGYDTKNPLAGAGGKTEALKRLKLKGDVQVIGDGYTDYELKKNGVASSFFAFTENVSRGAVVAQADHVVPSFDEFLYVSGLPTAVSYPKNRLKALLLENVHADAVARLKREGYSIETFPKSISEEELIKKIRDVSVLGIRSKTEVTERVLMAANKLLVVGAFCIGTNQIDLAAAARRGVPVFNAPYSNTRSVVELAIGEIIMLMRTASDKSAKLHRGEWDKSSKNCYEIRGKKLGIIGYGNIGSQLSVVAESLGMEVYFYDVVEKLALGNATKCNSMAELLKKSDVVTVHVDGTPRNKNLIGERELKLMKKGSYVLNLSRGSVVDIKALAEAVKSGNIAGVGIDVYPTEPKGNDEAFVSELQGLPNVIMTPHIGGSTEEAQKNIGEFVATRIVDFVNTGATYLSVNIPNIQLPTQKKAHRFIHMHANQPGILAEINGVLAKHKINILGQYLKTDEGIGYVITDVSTKYDERAILELKKVPHTIRFRVLY